MAPNRQRLVALIEHLDDGIGKVLDTLDKSGLADNTLVMFTSDNGGVLANGANNGPWRAGKTHMYEGGLRVPFAARWPGHIKPRAHSPRIALTMDIFPTALAAAGAALPHGIDALSLLDTFSGQADADPRKNYYFVWREGGPLHGGKTVDALRQGEWKLLQDNPFAPLELYNLSSDPKESNDLAGTEKKVVRDLDAELRRQIQRGGTVPWQRPEE